ncbi:MAG: septum formation protein Maf [Gammaproteobacteria bacterium]|nr:septum formation protein Maf [Gammaproteobacteria bacterium]
MSLVKNKFHVILASQSPFRAELLNRLGIDFEQVSSDIDETCRPGESAQELTQRLATRKAQFVLDRLESMADETLVIIGSDQVASHRGKILGKPRSRENAIKQLSTFKNDKVEFFTAVSVLTHAEKFEHLDVTQVYFKELSLKQIENYVDAEDVLNCAGSFKSEGLGISLFKKIKNQDPTALIGLPMIWVANCLQKIGIKIP